MAELHLPHFKATSREYQRIYDRVHRQRDPIIAKNYRDTFTQKHGDGIFKKYEQDRRRILKQQLYDMLGMNCNRCGFSDTRALQLDHIKDDGHTDRKRFAGHLAMVRYYIEHPDEAKLRLQILCANCNWIKRAANGRVISIHA